MILEVLLQRPFDPLDELLKAYTLKITLLLALATAVILGYP